MPNFRKHIPDKANLATIGLQDAPIWPAPGYDAADEIQDHTDWSLNPDAASLFAPACAHPAANHHANGHPNDGQNDCDHYPNGIHTPLAFI